jgi:hypothetical protein
MKRGDKIAYKDGSKFCNGETVVTVGSIDGNTVIPQETNAWTYIDLVHVVQPASTPFDKALEELQKEVTLYEEKVKEFGRKVDELQVAIKVMENLIEKY